jgi:hypothetical protein
MINLAILLVALGLSGPAHAPSQMIMEALCSSMPTNDIPIIGRARRSGIMAAHCRSDTREERPERATHQA